ARSINISGAGFGQDHGTSQKIKYLRVVSTRTFLVEVNYTAPSQVGCAGTSVYSSDRGCFDPVAALECNLLLLVLRLHFGTRHSNGLDTISRGTGHNLRHTVIVVQVHQGHVVVELKAGSARLILHDLRDALVKQLRYVGVGVILEGSLGRGLRPCEFPVDLQLPVGPGGTHQVLHGSIRAVARVELHPVIELGSDVGFNLTAGTGAQGSAEYALEPADHTVRALQLVDGQGMELALLLREGVATRGRGHDCLVVGHFRWT